MNNWQCWLRRTSWTVIHPGIHLQYYSGTRVNKGFLRGWVIPTCNNKEHMLCLILYVQEGQSCFHSYRLRLQNCNQIGVLACKYNFTAGVHKNAKTTYPPQNDRDILYCGYWVSLMRGGRERESVMRTGSSKKLSRLTIITTTKKVKVPKIMEDISFVVYKKNCIYTLFPPPLNKIHNFFSSV